MAETVRVDFSELLGVADDLTRNTRDVPRLMNVIAEALVSEVQENFMREGATGGRPKWPDLADSTKRKRRKGPGRRRGAPATEGNFKILQDRGILAGSIYPDTGDVYAEAYTNVPYAVFHISPEPRRIIPLRDFFAIDEQAFTAEVTSIVLETLISRR
jgi:phage gpG-like protein